MGVVLAPSLGHWKLVIGHWPFDMDPPSLEAPYIPRQSHFQQYPFRRDTGRGGERSGGKRNNRSGRGPCQREKLPLWSPHALRSPPGRLDGSALRDGPPRRGAPTPVRPASPRKPSTPLPGAGSRPQPVASHRGEVDVIDNVPNYWRAGAAGPRSSRRAPGSRTSGWRSSGIPGAPWPRSSACSPPACSRRPSGGRGRRPGGSGSWRSAARSARMQRPASQIHRSRTRQHRSILLSGPVLSPRTREVHF